MNTLPIIAGFTDYLTNERHFSPYAARRDGADLRQYTEFIADEAGLEASDAAELQAGNIVSDQARPAGTPRPPSRRPLRPTPSRRW